MTSTNRELITVGHRNSVLSLAFTSDSQTLISTGSDGPAIWWDVETGMMRRHLRLPRWACSLTLSPDDAFAITNEGQVYDAGTTRLLRTSSRYMQPYAFSPDGRKFACAAFVPYSDDTCILVISIRSGRSLRILPYAGSAESMAFSSDGGLLAVFGYEHSNESDAILSTTVFNSQTAESYRLLESEHVLLYALLRSTSACIAAVSRRCTDIWNAETGELLHTLPEHDTDRLGFPGNCVAMSQDGRLLATGTERGAVSVWDVPGSVCIWNSDPHPDYRSIKSIAFTPNGNTVAVGEEDGTIRIWETATGKLRHSLGGRGEVVRKVAIKSDTIKSLHYDGTARVWQISPPILSKQAMVFAETFPPGFHRDNDWDHDLWRVDAANPVTQSEIPPGLYSECISPDGSLLALCSNDRRIAILHRNTDRLVYTPPAALCRYAQPIFSPDGRFLATSSEEGDSLRVFDTATGETHMEIELDDPVEKELRVMVFSANSRLLVIGRDYSEIQLWNLHARKLMRKLDAGGEGIHAIAISPDERHVAVATYYSDTVWVKSLGRRGKQAWLVGHTGQVNSVSYSPDSAWIATGGGDGTVRLWEAATGRLLTTYTIFPDSSWAIYTPDSEYTCSPGAEQHLMWRVGDDLLPVHGEY